MSGQDDLPDLAFAEPDEPIHTRVGEWVAYAPISDRATRIYWLLRAHVNTNRFTDDGQPNEKAWPSQRRLAAILGVKRTETVGAAIQELVAIKAVRIEEERYANRMRRRYKYYVRLGPPEDYDGPRCNSEFVLPPDPKDDSGAKPAETQAVPDPSDTPTNPQVTRTLEIRGVRTPLETGSNKTNLEQDEDLTASPAAGHHAGARRHQATASRSSAHEAAARRGTRLNRAELRAWELDQVSPSWLTNDNPYLGEDIGNYVEAKWGCATTVRTMIESMVGRERRNGKLVEPRQILNAALKAARWDDAPWPSDIAGAAAFVSIQDLPADERAMYDPDYDWTAVTASGAERTYDGQTLDDLIESGRRSFEAQLPDGPGNPF